jgi:hypothetical protein
MIRSYVPAATDVKPCTARHECVVVAPSLIPIKAGDRIKTDRRGPVRNFVCGVKIRRKDPHHGASQTSCYSGCPS